MANFETKDSGKRMEFGGGMQRDTQEGKTLFHLVFDGPLLKRWAELLTRGAVKYSPGNWMKAEGQEEYDRFRASAARHFFQWMAGQRDEDHAAAVAFNLNGAEYVRDKLERTHINGKPVVVGETLHIEPGDTLTPPKALGLPGFATQEQLDQLTSTINKNLKAIHKDFRVIGFGKGTPREKTVIAYSNRLSYEDVESLEALAGAEPGDMVAVTPRVLAGVPDECLDAASYLTPEKAVRCVDSNRTLNSEEY